MFLIFMFIFFISAFLLLMYGVIKSRKVTVPFFLLLFLELIVSSMWLKMY